MSDVLNQIKQKIETTVKSGIETVEHLVGIGKTTAAKAVTAAEPAIAQAEAAVAQATTQVEASAAATLATTGATGALPGMALPPTPPAGNGLGNGPSGPQPPSA
jgi:hypothetical protein